MASQQLSNYLRSFRKQSALSQIELGYLLGNQSGSKVCRYEQFLQEPCLQTAIALEIIFQKPVSKLFPGLYQKISVNIKARADKLVGKTNRKPSNPFIARKRQTLAAIINMEYNVKGY